MTIINADKVQKEFIEDYRKKLYQAKMEIKQLVGDLIKIRQVLLSKSFEINKLVLTVKDRMSPVQAVKFLLWLKKKFSAKDLNLYKVWGIKRKDRNTSLTLEDGTRSLISEKSVSTLSKVTKKVPVKILYQQKNETGRNSGQAEDEEVIMSGSDEEDEELMEEQKTNIKNMESISLSGESNPSSKLHLDITPLPG